jgi:hypothetical protein
MVRASQGKQMEWGSRDWLRTPDMGRDNMKRHGLLLLRNAAGQGAIHGRRQRRGPHDELQLQSA